jgi:hypothetical protein
MLFVNPNVRQRSGIRRRGIHAHRRRTIPAENALKLVARFASRGGDGPLFRLRLRNVATVAKILKTHVATIFASRTDPSAPIVISTITAPCTLALLASNSG